MTRRQTHRDRHVHLRDAFDELVADYLRHHPDTRVQGLDVVQLAAWANAQARWPTEPPLRDARAHHNGTEFRAAPGNGKRHRCVLATDGQGTLRCTICAGNGGRG